MMEKRFKAVSPQSLTLDGNIYGLISVVNTRLFKVKQVVHIQNPGQPIVKAEVKRIESKTKMFVGPVTGSIDNRIDTSSFTVALGAFIYAEEQQRPKIAEQEVERNTYEEEPVVARRVILVDTYGDDIASSGSIVNSDEPCSKFIYGNALEVLKIIEFVPGAVVGDLVKETNFTYGPSLEVIKICVSHRPATAGDLT
jgi:hypothetical protein